MLYIYNLVNQLLEWICFNVPFAVAVTFSCIHWIWYQIFFTLSGIYCNFLSIWAVTRSVASIFQHFNLFQISFQTVTVQCPKPPLVSLWSYEMTLVVTAKKDCIVIEIRILNQMLIGRPDAAERLAARWAGVESRAGLPLLHLWALLTMQKFHSSPQLPSRHRTSRLFTEQNH